MVERRVQIVYSNGVDTEPLHESSISEADRTIRERVDAISKCRGSSRLVSDFQWVSTNSFSCLLFILRNTNDLEPGIIDTVHEVGAFDNKRADSQDGGGEKRNERGKGIKKLRFRQLCDKLQEWFHLPAPYRICMEKAWGMLKGLKSSMLSLNEGLPDMAKRLTAGATA